MTAAAKLDTEKFRKVHALMKGGSTQGERDAARVQAGKIANRAGMTIEQAMSKLDTPSSIRPVNFFDGFEDWMEEREPGYKARRAAEKDDRETAKERLRNELIARYGSEEAVFNHTPEEEALERSVAHLAAWSSFIDHLGIKRRCVSNLDGVRLDYPAFEKLTPAVVSAVAAAYRLPADLSEVLAEHHQWNTLRTNREAFLDGEWIHNMEVTARISVLEHELDARPAATWQDMDARLAWWQEAINQEFTERTETHQARHDRIAADLAHLRQATEPVQTGRRTNADKRSAVLFMLDEQPDLSDREIARRCGVSPQTVNTWRKKVSA